MGISELTTLSDQETRQREQIVACVRKYGGAASDAILDPACKIFQSPNIEGVIGYRSEGTSLIAFGDPAAKKEDKIALAKVFNDFALDQGKTVIYIAASHDFAEEMLKNLCKVSVEFGTELDYDPTNDPRKLTGTQASLVRRKVRHALHDGVECHEYMGDDPKIEKELEQVADAWLKGRRGLQVYISHIRLFDDPQGKRWFYAKQGGRIIGVLMLHQLQAYRGWLINRLMITPDAAHGTPELLVVTALDSLRLEDCPFATFGAVSGDHLGKIEGLGKFSKAILMFTFKVTKSLFHLEGHMKFWGKFHPISKPSYLLFSKSNVSISELSSLMKALNVSVKILG